MRDRNFLRIPTDMNVVLFYNQLPVVACCATNISRDGLFVRTGPVSFHKNAHLEIEFLAQHRDYVDYYRLPATVVYHNRTGLGLQFDTLTEENEMLAHALLGHNYYHPTAHQHALAANTI